MDKGLETRYFLGANTGAGYCSFFSHFLRQPGRCVHILKGGPGCGKSTFLRRVGERTQQLGLHTVYLHCSGDPGSLDGVFFPETNTGYLDGTAPHVCDPVLFGITGDYLDLGAFCRTKLLDTERIRQLSMDCPLFYRRAYEYLAAAAALDARKQPGLLFPEDRAAARRRAAGTALREFGAVKKDAVPGRFEKRFLRAITCEGRAAFPQTVEALAERVYLLDNDCGLAEDYRRCWFRNCTLLFSPRMRNCHARTPPCGISGSTPFRTPPVCARCAPACAPTSVCSSRQSTPQSASFRRQSCCTTSWRPSTSRAWTLTRSLRSPTNTSKRCWHRLSPGFVV